MRFFEEIQAYNRWYVYGVTLLVAALFMVVFYSETEGFLFQEKPFPFLFSLIFSGIPIVILFTARLKTKITERGITATFYPFSFFRRSYTWNEIEKVFVRKYSALTEFGGRGIKIFTSGKAYTVAGSYGIQIVTKGGNQFLIGTQEPKKVQQILDKYSNNQK